MTSRENEPQAPGPEATGGPPSSQEFEEPVMLIDQPIPKGEAETVLGTAGPPNRQWEDRDDR